MTLAQLAYLLEPEQQQQSVGTAADLVALSQMRLG
jgi:hypothetical protein